MASTVHVGTEPARQIGSLLEKLSCKVSNGPSELRPILKNEIGRHIENANCTQSSLRWSHPRVVLLPFLGPHAEPSPPRIFDIGFDRALRCGARRNRRRFRHSEKNIRTVN